MAYYDALIAKWATLNPGTIAQKLAQINGLTVQTAAAGSAILTPSQIINAIVFTDLATLTQLQLLQLTLLLSGGSVDASKGTPIRVGIQALFAGKTQTLTNLAVLVASADAPTVIPWWQSAGYQRPFDLGDVAAAGLN
jgi:hypothetical protein